MSRKIELLDRRRARVRRAIRKAANGRPRLSVFRSSKQIYVQVIDDATGHTLAAASSLDKDLRPASRPAPTRPPRPRSASWWRSAPRRPG